MTEYRQIVGFSGYVVGNDGSVWSRVRSKEWKKLRPQVAGKDRKHHKVILTRDGLHSHRYMHHLVLEAFVGLCPEGLEACHADDNGFNNNLLNLRWDTRKANRLEGHRNEVNPHGIKHYRAKLTEDSVQEIRRLISCGLPNEPIAAQFGVTRGAIQGIRVGRTWKQLDTKDL